MNLTSAVDRLKWTGAELKLFRFAVYSYVLFRVCYISAINLIQPRGLELLTRYNFFDLPGSENPGVILSLTFALTLVAFSGWKKPFIGFLLYLSYVVFDFTCYDLQDGGSTFIKLALFYLIFINPDALEEGLSKLAVGALRIQFLFIYIFSFVSKISTPEWISGDALIYILQNPEFSILNGLDLTWMPLKFFSFLIIALQIIIPIGLFQGRFRTACIKIGVGFHAINALVLGIPLLSLGILTGYLLWIENGPKRKDQDPGIKTGQEFKKSFETANSPNSIKIKL